MSPFRAERRRAKENELPMVGAPVRVTVVRLIVIRSGKRVADSTRDPVVPVRIGLKRDELLTPFPFRPENIRRYFKQREHLTRAIGFANLDKTPW